MDAQLVQMRQAANPDERRRFLRGHTALMCENVQLMQRLAGGSAPVGQPPGMDMMGGQGGGMTMGGMMGNMMGGLMGGLMDQLLAQHEQLIQLNRQPSPAPPPSAG